MSKIEMRGFYGRSTPVFNSRWRISSGHPFSSLLLPKGALVCLLVLRTGIYVFSSVYIFPRNVGASSIFELPTLSSGT
jgi:hypothetical protein